MVGFKRLSTEPYQIETFLIPIEEVMLGEKKLPDEYITQRSNNVTEAYCDWCRPLIGQPLPKMARLY